jgi:hypothetical protein
VDNPKGWSGGGSLQTYHFISGVYSVEEAKRKWKNLRDRCMKIISAENLPSGVASKKKNKWHFYESLNFLRDMLLRIKYKKKLFFNLQKIC